jgi:hypothetical protein
MKIESTYYSVTTKNIDDVRKGLKYLDQAEKLQVGCETWEFANGQIRTWNSDDYDQATGFSPASGTITVWPMNGRAALGVGYGDSTWGEWDAGTRTIRLDDNCGIVNEDGDFV